MLNELRNKLPVSAIVIGRNEGGLLRACLESLEFCAELLYVDMASDDESKTIASCLGARVIEIEPSPIVELVRQELTGLALYPWILYLDPDERVSNELALHLRENWLRYSASRHMAAIDLPIRYYAFGRRLKGTVWGGEKSVTRLVHRERFAFSSFVHRAGTVQDGSDFRELVRASNEREIRHMWLTNLRAFLLKHARYIRAEGPDASARGLSTTVRELFVVFPREFLACYIKRHGYRDGLLGLSLSLFWAGYQFASKMSLFMFQKNARTS